jgi:hypothetical protein
MRQAVPIAGIANRSEQTPLMALLASTEGVTHDPEGNALSGMVPGEDAFAVPRLLFRDHGQFGDAYVLHDLSADPVLDRVYQSRAWVGNFHPVGCRKHFK